MYKVKTNSKEPIITNQIIFVNQKKFSAYRLNHFCRMIDEEFLITFSDTFQFKWIRGGETLLRFFLEIMNRTTAQLQLQWLRRRFSKCQGIPLKYSLPKLVFIKLNTVGDGGDSAASLFLEK